jgi:hypothetical protein
MHLLRAVQKVNKRQVEQGSDFILLPVETQWFASALRRLSIGLRIHAWIPVTERIPKFQTDTVPGPQ